MKKLYMTFDCNGKKVVLSSGIWGWIFSIALIALRAMSHNSPSIEDWSVLSWIFMTCPITWPWIAFIVARILYWLLSGVIWIYEKVTKD